MSSPLLSPGAEVLLSGVVSACALAAVVVVMGASVELLPEPLPVAVLPLFPLFPLHAVRVSIKPKAKANEDIFLIMIISPFSEKV